MGTNDCCEIPDLLFQCPEDVAVDECLIAELFWSSMQKHPFYVIDQTAGTNIYGEPSGDPELAPIGPVYTLIEPSFPFHIKLDPEAEDLSRYGYDRTRDCLASFSTQILRSINLEPKVGDRFDFVFNSPTGNQVVEHFEIHEISPVDFMRNTLVPATLVAAADRTHKARKP